MRIIIVRIEGQRRDIRLLCHFLFVKIVIDHAQSRVGLRVKRLDVQDPQKVRSAARIVAAAHAKARELVPGFHVAGIYLQ